MERSTRPRLYLVRHGQTAWNDDGRLLSHTDEPLNARGEDQAVELGRRLHAVAWSKVISSPALRTRQTTELVLSAAGRSMRYEIDARMRELDFGPYEGWTELELAADPVAATRRASGAELPGMETMESLEARAAGVWAELGSLTGNTLVVGHGRMLRALIVRFVLGASGATVSALRIRHCRPAVVEPGPRPLLLGFNLGDPADEALDRLG